MENNTEKIFNKRFFIKKSKEAGIMKLDDEKFSLINKIHGKTEKEIVEAVGKSAFTEEISSCMVKPKEGHVEPVRTPAKKAPVKKTRQKRESSKVQTSKGMNDTIPPNTPLSDNPVLLSMKKKLGKKKK